MENPQNQRVSNEAAEERPADGSQTRVDSITPLIRMLANPRRTRRA